MHSRAANRNNPNYEMQATAIASPAISTKRFPKPMVATIADAANSKFVERLAAFEAAKAGRATKA